MSVQFDRDIIADLSGASRLDGCLFYFNQHFFIDGLGTLIAQFNGHLLQKMNSVVCVPTWTLNALASKKLAQSMTRKSRACQVYTIPFIIRRTRNLSRKEKRSPRTSLGLAKSSTSKS